MLQIIRLDSHFVERVNLELGNNIIGSSVVPTGSDDESVVKHAFTINLARNHEMTITPALPCYMKTRESSRWQLLETGITLPIKPGDICALLENKCWFKIVSMADNMEPVCQSGTKRKVDEDLADSNVEIAEKKLCVELQAKADHNSIEAVAESSINIGTEQSKPQQDQVESSPNKEEETVQVVESGQELPDETVSGNENSTASLVDEETRQTYENPEVQTNEEAQGDLQPEAATVSTSNPESQSLTNGQSDTAGSGEPSTISWREKCKYGENCYRKNPNHKSKYSHPGNADYDMPDNRAACPYGKRCYRKNEQHKAQFKHPPKNSTGRSRSRRRLNRPTYQDLFQDDDFSDDTAEESIDESDYDPSSESQDNSEDEQYSSGIEWEDETVV